MAITKYHRLGDLNNINVSSTVLEAGNPRARSSGSVAGEGPFPDL